MKMLGRNHQLSLHNSHTSSASSQPSQVSKALWTLVTLYCKDKTDYADPHSDPRLVRVFDFCVRILRSRLQPTILGDELHLLTLIQKKRTLII